MPSVLRALCGVSGVPAVLVAFEGVSRVAPQTRWPEPASRTWNFGELWSVIRYIVNFVEEDVVWIIGGTLALPGEAATDCSHGDMPPPVRGSPPWPSITPSPTMADPAPDTVMRGVVPPHV